MLPSLPRSRQALRALVAFLCCTAMLSCATMVAAQYPQFFNPNPPGQSRTHGRSMRAAADAGKHAQQHRPEHVTSVHLSSL